MTTTAALPKEAATPQVSDRELIHSDRSYLASDAANMLGIGMHWMRQAVFNSERFRSRGGDKENPLLRGVEIIDWVLTEGREYHVSPDVIESYRQQRASLRSRNASASSPLDAAEALVASEQDEEIRGNREVRDRYIKILRNWANPGPDVARDLAAVMQDMGIDRAQVEADLQIIVRLGELRERHFQREPARNEFLKVAGEHEQMKKRHFDEERESSHRKIAASDRDCACREAYPEALALTGRRPELFEMRDGFPELILSEEAAPALTTSTAVDAAAASAPADDPPTPSTADVPASTHTARRNRKT